MTLTEFLLERIAEDEGRASDALSAEPNYPHFGDTPADALLGLAESEGADTSALLHFGRHRPARVLAECAAKRRIVMAHGSREFVHPGGSLLMCRADSEACPCFTLRALALPYADHPDYREEWRP